MHHAIPLKRGVRGAGKEVPFVSGAVASPSADRTGSCFQVPGLLGTGPLEQSYWPKKEDDFYEAEGMYAQPRGRHWTAHRPP